MRPAACVAIIHEVVINYDSNRIHSFISFWLNILPNHSTISHLPVRSLPCIPSSICWIRAFTVCNRLEHDRDVKNACLLFSLHTLHADFWPTSLRILETLGYILLGLKYDTLMIYVRCHDTLEYCAFQEKG
jgi:hypothetical protein